ncbi:hypothetical protein BGZ49_007098 [Haplosporangium sp. Z 27]|nr:hypothetical protein BGZ49_007098 [Haplosporangium sp. Z 27]
MAPKQKASEAGGKSNNNNTSNDRQGTSERGHGHTNGTSASERGGGGNERTSSGAGHGHGHGHGEKTSGANTGGGTKRKAEAPIISVDIADLEINALRRYCRLNKLKPKSKSREDLATVATKHWNSVNAKEIDSVAYFLFAVKHRPF